MDSKQHVIGKCEGFTHSQNITILNFLIEMNAKICENNDGSRVNLDKLSKRQLNRLKKKVDEVDEPVEEKYTIN